MKSLYHLLIISLLSYYAFAQCYNSQSTCQSNSYSYYTCIYSSAGYCLYESLGCSSYCASDEYYYGGCCYYPISCSCTINGLCSTCSDVGTVFTIIGIVIFVIICAVCACAVNQRKRRRFLRNNNAQTTTTVITTGGISQSPNNSNVIYANNYNQQLIQPNTQFNKNVVPNYGQPQQYQAPYGYATQPGMNNFQMNPGYNTNVQQNLGYQANIVPQQNVNLGFQQNVGVQQNLGVGQQNVGFQNANFNANTYATDSYSTDVAPNMFVSDEILAQNNNNYAKPY